jgi:hypothetical protein
MKNKFLSMFAATIAVTMMFVSCSKEVEEPADENFADVDSRLKAVTVSLSATAGNGQVSLSWTVSGSINAIEVYRDLDSNPSGRTRIASLSSSARSYTATGLSNGTTYYFWIKARQSSDNVWYNSNAASATPSGSSGGTKYITATIEVNGTVYDGGGQRIIAQGMGDGSQSEGQKPIFKVTNGTVRNVRIAAPGCDGIHTYGNCTIENVVWEDVGEDALTVKGSGNTTVSGGSATAAADKVFQLNAACTFTVRNFTATTFGKVIRQNGGTTFQCNIYIDNCTFNGNSSECIARTDSPSTQLYYRNMRYSSIDQLWIFPSSSQIHTY